MNIRRDGNEIACPDDSLPDNSPEQMVRLREVFGEQIAKIQASGKLESAGIYADDRGGYMIIDVNNSAELLDLLGGAMLDRCNITTHPIVTTEELGEYFKNNPPK